MRRSKLPAAFGRPTSCQSIRGHSSNWHLQLHCERAAFSHQSGPTISSACFRKSQEVRNEMEIYRLLQIKQASPELVTNASDTEVLERPPHLRFPKCTYPHCARWLSRLPATDSRPTSFTSYGSSVNADRYPKKKMKLEEILRNNFTL